MECFSDFSSTNKSDNLTCMHVRLFMMIAHVTIITESLTKHCVLMLLLGNFSYRINTTVQGCLEI